MKYSSILLCTLGVFAAFFVQSKDINKGCTNEYITDVSIIKLLSNPNDYSGQCVRVKGVVNIGHESNYIFLDSESFKYYLKLNGIKLSLNNEMIEKYNTSTSSYVLIEGIFLNKESGQKAILTDITRLERLVPVFEGFD